MEHKSNAYRAETSRSAGSIIRANVFTLFNAIVFACFGVLFALGRWQNALFGSSTGEIVLYAAVIAALWTPAANRFFRPVLRAGC
ncbi:hypothetical protein [uncultured Microbacterium sp.]|uniref:hypothetical protein n=1 Tax=uncultured Microbacterium sp. TaxID=191216 RepID=UPI00261F62A3|nr:hypothetical protein [uncultured Microbacterium sp.]